MSFIPHQNFFLVPKKNEGKGFGCMLKKIIFCRFQRFIGGECLEELRQMPSRFISR